MRAALRRAGLDWIDVAFLVATFALGVTDKDWAPFWWCLAVFVVFALLNAVFVRRPGPPAT